MKQDEIENCTFEPSVGTQNAMGKDVNDETKEIKRVGGSCISYYLGKDYNKVFDMLNLLAITSVA